MRLEFRGQRSQGWGYPSESQQGTDDLVLASFSPMRKLIIPILWIKKLKFREVPCAGSGYNVPEVIQIQFLRDTKAHLMSFQDHIFKSYRKFTSSSTSSRIIPPHPQVERLAPCLSYSTYMLDDTGLLTLPPSWATCALTAEARSYSSLHLKD